MYLTFDVFDFLPREVIAEDLRNEFFIRGQVWQTQDKVAREVPERSIEYILIQKNQAERGSLRAFFDSKFGRVNPFWIKSHISDYRTTQVVTIGENEIPVRTEFGIAELLLTTRHIFFPLSGDMRRIISAVPGSEIDELVLILDSGITTDLPVNSEIQNLYFVRFDTDNLRIETNNLSHSPVTTTSVIRFRELQRETPSA